MCGCVFVALVGGVVFVSIGFVFGCLLVLWRRVVFGVLAVLAGWRVGVCSRACSLFVSMVLYWEGRLACYR